MSMPDTNPRVAPTEGQTKTDDKLESVGVPNPQSLRDLAEDLPENDAVQKAYKAGMLADTAQQEAKAKVTAVNESPNAAETPSGHALKKSAGTANDTERGEKYLREKTARRWGYVPVD